MNKVTQIIRGILKGSVVIWWCHCWCGGYFANHHMEFLKGGLLWKPIGHNGVFI